MYQPYAHSASLGNISQVVAGDLLGNYAGVTDLHEEEITEPVETSM